MFPVHAKCVTLEAGYEMERKKASEHLEVGKVYTVRQMYVHQSSSTLEFYEIKGTWNTVFFDACHWNGEPYDVREDEDDEQV